MKTLIVYGGKYGCTEKCAKTLSSQLDGQVDLVNITTTKVPALTEYEKIIIGGSIYMGQIQKQIKEFCTHNLGALKTKKIALFICCGIPENKEQHMQNAFPKELLDKAVAKECFGGELNVDKMKFFHRLISNLMSKAAAKDEKKSISTFPENIKNMAKVMNAINS